MQNTHKVFTIPELSTYLEDYYKRRVEIEQKLDELYEPCIEFELVYTGPWEIELLGATDKRNMPITHTSSGVYLPEDHLKDSNLRTLLDKYVAEINNLENLVRELKRENESYKTLTSVNSKKEF